MTVWIPSFFVIVPFLASLLVSSRDGRADTMCSWLKGIFYGAVRCIGRKAERDVEGRGGGEELKKPRLDFCVFGTLNVVEGDDLVRLPN